MTPSFGWGRDRGLVVSGDASSWATLSPDGKYRYALARTWDPMLDSLDAVRPTMTWVMLNPSTADDLVDDPTIRKCVGFAKRYGCGGIVVVNVFAWRETDPRKLTAVADPIGPHNIDAIAWACSRFWNMRIGGWGRFPSKRVQRASVRSVCTAKMGHLSCFGVTADGEPRHPLMLPYAAPLYGPGKWPYR